MKKIKNLKKLFFLCSAFLFLLIFKTAQTDSILEIKKDDLVLGDINSPITIIEYASLSCSHCSNFHKNTLPQIIEEYINTGKANTALDRIGKFSYKINADIYINVQGDEPIVNVYDIKKIIRFSTKYKNAVLFGKTACDKKTFFDCSKAKVVVDENDKVLYTSRSGIPLSSKGKFIRAFKVIWIYSLPKKLIRKYFLHGSGKLELLEQNEVLRFLEMNIDTYAINLKGNSWAVDEKKDIAIVRKMLAKRNLFNKN